MSKSIEQNNNIAFNGDIVAGNKTTYNTFKTPSLEMINNLNELYNRLDKEVSDEKRKSDFLEKYKKLSSALPDDTKNLETKLVEGNRKDLVDRALRGKQAMYNKIKDYEYYQSAQRIYEILLAKVITLFELKINSKINDSNDSNIIDTSIYDDIISEIQQNVLGTNYLKIDDDDILNMIYFLTGNCHIKWSKDDNL